MSSHAAETAQRASSGELGSAQLTFHDLANQLLGLSDSDHLQLHIDPTPERAISVPIEIDGQVYTLSLMPHSVRSPNYRLVVQGEGGVYREEDPGVNRMLRGSIVELPGSHAAGGLLEDGLYVAISLPDGARRWIEPLFGRVPGAGVVDHVMYRSEDACCPMGLCGMTDAFLAEHPPEPFDPIAGGIDGASVRCTEIAIDSDVEFFTVQGSVGNVQNRVNLLINTMNNQYVNQVGIQHVITHVIVREAEPDPYSSTVAGTILSEFQNHWQTSQSGVPRDVAHMFTGKNMDGTTIGIAYLNGICNGQSYGVVQHQSGVSCATDLSAHELGHNWSAQHCTSTCNSTMNAGLQCANTFANSSPNSIDQISTYRDTRGCLSACADATLPFVEEFPSTTFDDTKWASISGASISTLGSNEPSPPNSLRLRGNSSTGGNQARTARINAAGLTLLQMSYYYQRGGGGTNDPPEAGDDLIVEFWNDSNVWQEISRQPGAGSVMTTYAQASVTFPASALHSEFRLRFRVSSSQNNLDTWFVDNINVTGVSPPFNDPCADATLIANASVAFSTLGATTDGPAETSGCGFAGDGQLHKDIWYKYFAQCTGTATVSVCGANFNTRIVVYPVCPTAAGQSIACNDDACGQASQVTFPVTQNQLYRVRIGGVNGAAGSGIATFSCQAAPPPACPADLNSDQQVGVADLLAVIGAWGPCPPQPSACATDVAPTGGDGQVGVADLLLIIGAWGQCP